MSRAQNNELDFMPRKASLMNSPRCGGILFFANAQY